jgi:lipopolysaccharide export system permease protein
VLRKIDRYILGKFLGTYALTMALILAIAVVIDISEKIDDFINQGAPIQEIILDYYLNFLVFYGNLFNAMIVFIATIFFTSRMTNNSEIVAILTGGVSFRRLLWPYFVGALLVAGLNFYLSHYVIPTTNQDRLAFEMAYFNSRNEGERFKNIHRQIFPNHFIYLENYNERRMTGYHFSYEVMEDSELRMKLMADYIRRDTGSGTWKLDNYYIRRIDSTGQEHLQQGRRLDTNFRFKPEEIVPRLHTVEMMPTPKLNRFIAKEKIRGSENINRYLLEKHGRTSTPISTFILVLIGVSLSSQKTRGGLGLNLAVGLLLCVSYVFFMKVTVSFATVGSMAPLLAVHVPNLVFLVLGLWLYWRAPK